ncbi:MAG: 30S ribosomal protein S21 [Gammaproteobacteria bacterium]
MPAVFSRRDEDPMNTVRRFKRICDKSQLLTDIKKNLRHTKKSVLRAAQKAAARKRYLKQLAKNAPVPARAKKRAKKKRRRP